MEEKILQLDIKSILKARVPEKKRRWIPSFLVTAIERLIRQRELNEILRNTLPSQGSEFARRVMDYLDIRITVEGLDSLPEDRRYMFACNHPLGGLDGIALISTMGKKYGDDNIRFLVNDLLLNVTPLKDMFLPVNKFGKQGRSNTAIINENMASNIQIFQFPAGLCSRLQDNGEISDLDWQKSFVVKAREYRRDIVPVYFEGRNSRRFYRIARWRKKLGVKVNLEQVLLPSEICKARGSRYRIVFGKPVSWESLMDNGKQAKDVARELREASYKLGNES